MTNITKAAQDALEALEEIHAGKRHPQLALAVAQQLRAALQDKAGEVRQFRRVGCADWYDGNPDHEDGRGPYEARTLYAAQPAPVVPEMSSIAIRKLGGLQERGWQINGYAIRRGNERGLIDSSGFVGWWRSEIAPVAPEDVARDAGWFRLIRDGSGWPAVFASHDAPEPLRGDDLDAAMIDASQQKGGSAG